MREICMLFLVLNPKKHFISSPYWYFLLLLARKFNDSFFFLFPSELYSQPFLLFCVSFVFWIVPCFKMFLKIVKHLHLLVFRWYLNLINCYCYYFHVTLPSETPSNQSQRIIFVLTTNPTAFPSPTLSK